MVVVYVICLVLIVLSGVMWIFNRLLERRNHNHPVKRSMKKPHFGVLIPAKDESKVISGLLASIGKQTRKVAMKDVYVIVESLEDPTVGICEHYGVQVICRKHLELKRKGYALDEAVKQIKVHYDAYFIIDADNILDNNFFKYMEKVYLKGYDIGVGYRDNKNWSDNVVSACSGLLFLMANSINENKNTTNECISVTGTGFYIRGNIIEDFKGYPFHELTEDYELTLYATVNKLTTYYEPRAIFYDEQPLKFKETVKQRIRWVKGYFNARKEYLPKLRANLFNNVVNYGSVYKEIMWLRPILTLALALVIFYASIIVHTVYTTINNTFTLFHLLLGLIVIVIIYFILLGFTLYQLIKHKKHIKISNGQRLQVLLYNPLYLISFIHCALVAFINPNIGWEKIEHTKETISN